MTIKEIGCCGAYCKTCITWQKEKCPTERTCPGCKLGYDSTARDANKAKCKMKVCCFVERKLETCADCPACPCQILTTFWNKTGWKYGQYKKQLEYIRNNGYQNFLKNANKWKRATGKLIP
jgi:hypothetical protein